MVVPDKEVDASIGVIIIVKEFSFVQLGALAVSA